MNDEPTQPQNVAQLVERLSNAMNAARAEMSKTAAGFRSRPGRCNEPTPPPAKYHLTVVEAAHLFGW